MHGENLELSLKDREPVNASVTNFFSQNLNQGHNILAKWMLLKWWGLLSTWRQGRAHCTTWEELSHHRELVPSPPHESSLDSASWYKILFFLRNYVLILLWITFGSATRIVSWSGLIQRSWRSTRSYSLELAMKAAIDAIREMLHFHSLQ